MQTVLDAGMEGERIACCVEFVLNTHGRFFTLSSASNAKKRF
jgi:hypothetical protein